MKKMLALILAAVISLSLTTCTYAELRSGARSVEDYEALMVKAAVCGDVRAGRQAELGRRALLEATASDGRDISFDDLYLLAKLMSDVAGSDRLSDELRLCVGEVVLNRVASPCFPDTVGEVIYQEGAYPRVHTEEFAFELLPTKRCAQLALSLLSGERMLEPDVLYQSSVPTEGTVATFFDFFLGCIYFSREPNTL